MDARKPTDQLSVRLVMERPNREAIRQWSMRIESYGLVIDSASDRSIDAHGAKASIEDALDMSIEKVGGEDAIVPRTDASAKPGTEPGIEPIKAYIPRKPSFF